MGHAQHIVGNQNLTIDTTTSTYANHRYANALGDFVAGAAGTFSKTMAKQPFFQALRHLRAVFELQLLHGPNRVGSEFIN